MLRYLQALSLYILLSCMVLPPPASAATPPEEADTAFKEGQRLEALQTADSYKAAIQSFLKAAEAYHQLGKGKEEGQSLNQAGEVSYSSGQMHKALEYFQRSLSIEREVGNKRGEATTLSNIGLVYDNIGQLQKALEYYGKALPMEQQAGDKDGEAATFHNMGKVFANLGQPKKALEYFVKALPLEEAVGDKSGKGATLTGMGALYWATGQPRKALEYYGKALPLIQQVGDKRGHAIILNDLGNIYASIGQPQKALEYLGRALPLEQKIEDKGGEGSTLTSIGGVYSDIGQPQKALEFLDKALPLWHTTGDKSGEANTLNNIGRVLYSIRQPQKALKYYRKALTLIQQTGNKRGQAYTLSNLGAIYDSIGQPQQALKYYGQALQLRKEVGDRDGEANTLSNMGNVFSIIGQSQKALEYYAKALPLNREVGDKSGEAFILTNDAVVLNKVGNRTEARKQYEQAMTAVDAVVGGITRDDLKRAAAESYQWIYGSYIQFLLQQNSEIDNQKALEISEKARSRALRDLLAGNTRELPSRTLLARETVRPFPARAENSQPAVISAAQQPSAAEVKRVVSQAALLRAATQVALHIGELPPLLSSTQAEPFSWKEAVQAAVDGPVISYHLLEKELAIFVVMPSGELHVVRSPVKPVVLLKLIQQARVAITSNDDPSETKTSLSKLYSVLIQPVEKWLPPSSTNPKSHTPTHPYIHTPTLTLIPYGPLFQVPFAALRGPDGRYLVQRYALRTAPSLTVLRYTRQRSQALEKVATRPALYGDPVAPAIARALPRLKGAADEVKSVASTLAAGNETMLHTGPTATEMAFRNEAPSATEIHLATHGYINEEQPQLSGVILGASQGPEPPYERDGFLTTAEVFRLKLNTRLVTLSACESGLGAVGADGVFGLQSAFLSAGSASLLSTLWKVDDTATSQLMQEFYTRWKKDPQHNRAEALREAQLSLLEKREFGAPLYWAAFLLTGEAR